MSALIAGLAIFTASGYSCEKRGEVVTSNCLYLLAIVSGFAWMVIS